MRTMAEEWLHGSNGDLGHVPIQSFLGHSPEKCRAVIGDTDPEEYMSSERDYVIGRVREKWPDAETIEMGQTQHHWLLVPMTMNWLRYLRDNEIGIEAWTTFKIGLWTTFVFKRSEDAILFRLSVS